MEIPARDFYRYLLLCGHQSQYICATMQRYSLLVPEMPDAYHLEQLTWAAESLGEGQITVPTALRRSSMQDMWAAYKGRLPGKHCRDAFHIANLQHIRKPIEALIFADWHDWEIAKAISASLLHNIEIRPEVVAAYRRYFFNADILTANDRLLVVMRSDHLRVASLGMPSDVLLYAVGLRYQLAKDPMERARDLAWKKWMLALESMPMRTDHESLKALAGLLSAAKALEIPLDKPGGDVPLVKLLRGEHPTLEAGLNG